MTFTQHSNIPGIQSHLADTINK